MEFTIIKVDTKVGQKLSLEKMVWNSGAVIKSTVQQKSSELCDQKYLNWKDAVLLKVVEYRAQIMINYQIMLKVTK